MSSPSAFERLRQVHTVAYDLAPAIRDIFDRAGLVPADLKTVQDLSRLPVFKKEAMLDLQRRRPPFGGFLAAPESEIARIFVSPGPINEPQLRGEYDGLGFGAAFAAAVARVPATACSIPGPITWCRPACCSTKVSARSARP